MCRCIGISGCFLDWFRLFVVIWGLVKCKSNFLFLIYLSSVFFLVGVSVVILVRMIILGFVGMIIGIVVFKSFVVFIKVCCR